MHKGLLSVLPPAPAGKTGWPWTEETDMGIYRGPAACPKVSIITPTYNQGHFIEETIRSILLQNYPNLEYIIIDGGSTDNTVDIIKKYEPWISYWVSERDRGQSHAINKGLEKCTGEICNWINSDDLLFPDTLYKVASHFARLPASTGVIHGGVEVFIADKVTGTEFLYATPRFERYISDLVFSQPTAFTKLCFVRDVGSLNESLRYGMDYDLFARLSCVCDFQPVTDLFARYRLHDESKTVKNIYNFRAERAQSFLSLCHWLGWNDILEEIYQFLPLLSKTPLTGNYSFEPREDILNNADKKKVIFYFLMDTLKHYYWFDQRDNARLLLKKMNAGFPQDWFAEDVAAKKIIQKLRLPEKLLVLLKLFKQYTSKNARVL